MVRRVLEEHGARQALVPDGAAVHRLQEALEPGPAEALVAQDRDAVLVAREHPEAERTLVHGVGLAQAMVVRERVGIEPRQERVEQDLG